MHVCYFAVAPWRHIWRPRPPHRLLPTYCKRPSYFFLQYFVYELVNTSCPRDSLRVSLSLEKLFFSSLAKADWLHFFFFFFKVICIWAPAPQFVPLLLFGSVCTFPMVYFSVFHLIIPPFPFVYLKLTCFYPSGSDP